MPFFDHSTGNMTSSVKILLLSTTVLSAAIMLKLSAPAITDFAVSDVPSIWNGVASWLKPPYLYLVINCIIITIVASSKLQAKSDDVSPSPHLPHESYDQVQPATVFPTKQAYDDLVFNGAAVAEAAPPVKPPRTEVLTGDYDRVEFDAFGYVGARVSETEDAFTVKAAPASVAAEVEMEMKSSNKFLISKSTWTPVSKAPAEYSAVSAEKPPPSARFGHRRKASIEGGKTVLGVSKPKRHDTLESTWKTITEGRAMPLTRHLKKSDTWEMHGRRHHNQQEEITPQKMTKSETFNDRNETSSMSPSPGISKLRKEPSLKKEPSLSQDELNKRVEAFIKKFNEEMRLQRQESLNQYMEMINRGAH